MQTLSIPQKDKIILAFGYIGRMLYDDPRRYTYDEIDQVIEVLKTRGYEIVPLVKSAPELAVTAPPTTTSAATLSPNERYTIESTFLPSLKAMAGKEGFVYKLPQMKYALMLLCRVTGIAFPK